MGEHAAVERPGRSAPFAEPGEQLPRFGLSSPAPAKGRFGWVSSPFPFSFPYFFSIWFFSHPN